MSFGWDRTKKVERIDRSNGQPYVSEATPRQIIQNAHGFRQDDILHSLVLAVDELIQMAEAQASSSASILKMKESINNATKENQTEAKRDNNDQDIAHNPQAIENNGKEGGSVSEPPSV